MPDATHVFTVPGAERPPQRYTVFDSVIIEETWTWVDEAWVVSVREFIRLPY